MTIRVAVILAGGLGTRIASISNGLPKILIPIAGKPFLDWKLQELSDQGIKEVFLLLQHGSKQISEHVRKSSTQYGHLKIHVVEEGDLPLGTGGALLNALDRLPETFLLTYGDNLLEESVSRIETHYTERKESCLLVLTSKVVSQERPNVAIMNDRVIMYSKTRSQNTKMKYLEYGYSLWSKTKISEALNGKNITDLSELFISCAERQSLGAYITDKTYYEIGTPEGFERTEKHLLTRSNP